MELEKLRRNEIIDVLCNADEGEVVFLLKEMSSLEKEIIREWRNIIKEMFGRFKVKFLEVDRIFEEEVFKDFLRARSLLDDKSFVDKLGLKLLVEFKYSLKHLPQSKKMMFNYALEGRRGLKGILHELNGMKLAKSVVLVPEENSNEFEKFLNRWGVKYRKREVIYEEI